MTSVITKRQDGNIEFLGKIIFKRQRITFKLKGMKKIGVTGKVVLSSSLDSEFPLELIGDRVCQRQSQPKKLMGVSLL